MIGQTLGHYKILEKLGAGGMGEVYRAEDSTLRREVALKVLAPDLASNQDRLDRFQREARTLAALDHPNIVTIYSIESAGVGSPTREFHFLTMQLIRGQRLADCIGQDGMTVDRLFEISIPIADALSAAHAGGVIHRDLKPANIMVTDSGQVKVLDFGLAKLRHETPHTEDTESPTEALTQAGTIIGTMPYMSPEQIQGRELDPRSDIFSLGAVLYEMAVGHRPFEGSSAAELLSSILRDNPSPVDSLRSDLPHHLGRIVRRCLAKDPAERFQTARDVYNELKGLQQELDTATSRIDLRDTADPTRTAEIRSLAVLPLDNLSGDKEQDYFADGMTEALITDLAKIGALKVISRTSIMQYKGVHKPLPQIAEELGVDAVLEGSVLRIVDSVRITTQLVDARTDEHLWAENYDHDVRDILALMSEVARSVADRVRVELTSQERSLLATSTQVDPEAHELYLKGRYFLSQLTREGVDKAKELMQAAIDRDPDYAQAYATLADAHLTFVLFGWQDYSEGLALVRAAALEALELDDTLADGHVVLASADARLRQYKRAERGFKRAIELSPNHARAHGDYSALLVWIGRFDEAIAQAKRALELEPLSLKAGIDLMMAYYYARRYREAERQIREVLVLHPGAPYAEWCLGITLAQLGRYDEAIETFLARQVPTAATNWALGYIYGIAGYRDKAQEVLDYLLEKSKTQYVAGDLIGYVYLGLGDKAKMIELLREQLDSHGGPRIYLAVDPWLDPLREDPRFQDLLRQMRFPTA